MRGFGNVQVLATGLAVILAILALPFIWLYDKLGGNLFIVIVFGIPAAIWWFVDWRKKQTQAKKQQSEARTEQARADAAGDFAKWHDDMHREVLLEKHREKEARRNQPKNEKGRVPGIDRDGEISIEWRGQFEEISRAWREGDYGFARDWLQKLAYRLKSEDAPEAVHTKFKALMAEFTRDDPLYADVMRQALPVVAGNPGIIQSQLAKQFPQFEAEQFRYAMYFGEVIGDVAREKKGRSYALTLPASGPEVDGLRESLKQMGTDAIQSRHRDYWIKRRDQMQKVEHLRPFLQLIGTCAGGDRLTLLASDPFWNSGSVPWNCCNDRCECQVNSLSRLEMARYVEAGCSPGDEAAKEQLKIWEQGERK